MRKKGHEIMHLYKKRKTENKDSMNIKANKTIIQIKMTLCMLFFFFREPPPEISPESVADRTPLMNKCYLN